MKMCATHWTALRAKIDERGLGHLVARSGKEAVEVLSRQADGIATAAAFDPLMGANFAIFYQYTKDVGLAAFEGDKCPLCEVEKSGEGRAQNWIDGSTQDQLDMIRAKRLLTARGGTYDDLS